MEEDEINIWFEDEKEKIIKDYFKKVDSILIKDSESEDKDEKEAVTPAQAKKLLKGREKEFIAASKKIRDRYDSLIYKTREKKKRKQKNKQRIKTVLSPFIFIWNIIKTAWKRSSESIKKRKKEKFDPIWFDIISKLKRKKQNIRLKTRSKLAPAKLFYEQNIWPMLHYINTPNRILKQKYIKLMDATKTRLKKIFSKTFGKAKKIIGFMWGKTKIIIGFFPGTVKKIIGISKAVREYLKNVWQVIKAKLFPENEE